MITFARSQLRWRRRREVTGGPVDSWKPVKIPTAKESAGDDPESLRSIKGCLAASGFIFPMKNVPVGFAARLRDDGKPAVVAGRKFGDRFIAPIGRGAPIGMATLAPAKLSLTQAFMPTGRLIRPHGGFSAEGITLSQPGEERE